MSSDFLNRNQKMSLTKSSPKKKGWQNGRTYAGAEGFPKGPVVDKQNLKLNGGRIDMWTSALEMRDHSLKVG